jgi:hypothetical protein
MRRLFCISSACNGCFTGETGGILISRILHQRMLPDRQGIDDEDDTPDST